MVGNTPEASAPVVTGEGASGSTPSVASIGTGSDRLVLNISQEAYQGDACYTVSVDGKQIGGMQTARTSRAADQSDVITLFGDWGPGDHTVSVNYLNDLYDGTGSTDRNLYVDGAAYNDIAVPRSERWFTSAGEQQFTFCDGALVCLGSLKHCGGAAKPHPV